MMFSVDLVFELAPFLSVMLVRVFSMGGDKVFEDKFEDIPVHKELGDVNINAIRRVALLSYHFEQSMRFIDISIISIFIIFGARAYRVDIFWPTIIAAIISLFLIIALRQRARNYFNTVMPMDYAERHKRVLMGMTFRRGDLYVILSNMIPMVLLFLLNVI